GRRTEADFENWAKHFQWWDDHTDDDVPEEQQKFDPNEFRRIKTRKPAEPQFKIAADVEQGYIFGKQEAQLTEPDVDTTAAVVRLRPATENIDANYRSSTGSSYGAASAGQSQRG
ncbi:unnamed protein product, partial [Amoebophrya sp. A120]